jgi:mannose-6-phosphate isomerase-like protein (cupin superfamily)
MASSDVAPQCFRLGEGKTYSIGRLTITFKTTGEEAPAYTLCEGSGPAGSGAALHRHGTYDEMHIVTEGQHAFQLGDEMLTLGPGDMVFVPRGVAHSTRVLGPGDGRQLVISTPAGIFDAFVAEVAAAERSDSASAGGRDLPAKAIGAKYGLEFLA